jgi:hypothetical protein
MVSEQPRTATIFSAVDFLGLSSLAFGMQPMPVSKEKQRCINK